MTCAVTETRPRPVQALACKIIVEVLELLRKQLGVDQVHFVVHSPGRMIEPDYARKNPERVISLTLLSTAAGRSKEDSEKVWSVVKKMEREGIPNVLPTLIDRWFTDDFIANRPEIVETRLKQVIDMGYVYHVRVTEFIQSLEVAN